MEGVRSVKAHFDGHQIVLDEAVNLLPDARLIVTVLSAAAIERAEWNHVSLLALARAYGDAEPEYSATDLKPE